MNEPKRTGQPTIVFKKKNGGQFTVRFKSRASCERAYDGWKAKGGKFLFVNFYG